MMKNRKHIMRSLIMAFLFFMMQVFCALSIHAEESEIVPKKGIILEKIDKAFIKLIENENEYKEYVSIFAGFLPEKIVDVLDNIISVAQLDISTEEKVNALLDASASNCMIYLYLWIIGLLITATPGLGALGAIIQQIAVLLGILCLLGLI